MSEGSEPAASGKPPVTISEKGFLGDQRGGGAGPRFWIDALSAGFTVGQAVELGADEARHAVKVLRLAVGQKVRLFDGAGTEADAALVSTGKGRVAAQITALAKVDRPERGVVVASAVPKGGRAEDMIEQLSQVGVVAWHPLVSERGVVEATVSKQQRLDRRALQSCKQCGRAWRMSVGERVTLSAVLDGSGALPQVTQWWTMDTQGVAVGAAFASVLQKKSGLDQDGEGLLGLLVGPEGGWTDPERQLMREAGVQRFRLPVPVMRIETAATVGAAVMACWSNSLVNDGS